MWDASQNRDAAATATSRPWWESVMLFMLLLGRDGCLFAPLLDRAGVLQLAQQAACARDLTVDGADADVLGRSDLVVAVADRLAQQKPARTLGELIDEVEAIVQAGELVGAGPGAVGVGDRVEVVVQWWRSRSTNGSRPPTR